MILSQAAAAAGHHYLHFTQLGLHPVLYSFHIFGHQLDIRWYSLAYITGILLGWWYLMKLLAQPGAPMARRHADDLVFYATIGIILGGRIGYILFYAPEMILHPLQMFRLWDGGMSFHGGAAGVSIAIIYLARKNGLNWLRIHDYVACCAPFGLFFGRIANFINGELWGRPTTVPWAIIFPNTVAFGPNPPRHPSQLYEAGLEGLLLFAILWFLFWRTKARYQPGKLVGAFLLGYGCARYFVEFFRQADEQYLNNPILGTPGTHMGQLLTIPMIIGGIYLIRTAKGRQERAGIKISETDAAEA